MRLLRKPQATRRVARGLSISTHLLAALTACVVAALAFGLPMDRLDPQAGSWDNSGLSQLEQPLILPEVEKTRLLDPDWSDQLETWETVTVEPGDTLAAIFNRLGLKESELYAFLAAGVEARALERLYPGQIFKLRVEDKQLQELVYDTDRISGVRIFRDVDHFKTSSYTHRIEKRVGYASGMVSNTLTGALREAGLSPGIRGKLTRIFSRHIDFERQIRPGDTFTILFEEHYFTGEKLGEGNILAAELSVGGQTHQAIGFPDAQNKLRYYTPEGEGLEPAFIRYPVSYSRISSPFSTNRRHPILGIRRPHPGIDLVAPTGTPVKAAGSGIIESIGWQRGYGKTVVLDHGRGYTTLYAHLSRFDAALKQGDQIERGQVIAYVGSTGLSTGPHLHYEVHIEGQPQDPARVVLPGDPSLSAEQLAAFRRQAGPLLAQLDLLQRTRVALRDN